MKLFYLLILNIFLLLVGCSSTYRMTDYASKEKFYEDINNSIGTRDFNVVADDSSFTGFRGSEIKNDSLYAVTRIIEKKETISSEDIKEIKYFGKAYEEPSADIWLKNGEELRAENLINLSGSKLQFTNLKISSGYIPINKVEEINYKTRWKSTLIGFPIGLVSGVLIGGYMGSQGWIFNVRTGGNEPLQFDKANSAIQGAFVVGLIGIIMGPIVGYITGWNYVFQFKP